ncbi:MAG TPA: methyltransferase domain-containing protein [Actinomycetes bacterium]|nr:methyltransferase domain-containing protein [Actinomycetes bacterium]
MAGEPDDVDAMVEPVVPSRHRWLAELLAAAPGDRVVDLGCGTGSTLAQVAANLLVGVDASAAALARAAEALAPVHGRRFLLVQADLKDPPPIAADSVDRVLCHDVLECLPDTDAFVAAAARVLRPDGRLVIAHTDYDTLVFTSEDLQLTRRLVHAYCDTQQPWMDAVDGTIGRHLVGVAERCGLVVEDVQASVTLSRRFQPGELGWGYAHNIVGALQGAGWADQTVLDGWLDGLRRLDERGAFLFSLNDYAVVCGRMRR